MIFLYQNKHATYKLEEAQNIINLIADNLFRYVIIKPQAEDITKIELKMVVASIKENFNNDVRVVC